VRPPAPPPEIDLDASVHGGEGGEGGQGGQGGEGGACGGAAGGPCGGCLWTSEPLCILESHGDCVAELPAGAALLASSARCAHEAFVSASGNVLGIQGHPELSALALLERIWPAVVETHGRLDAAEAAEALDSLRRPRHAGLVSELLRRFLRPDRAV
jgi:hypothetical protein